MTTEFSGTGIQTWTSVDISAVDMASKSVRFSYFGGTDQISKDLKEEECRAASLGPFIGTPLKSRRFRALARNAARSGKRLVIEIHDQNPVKTISSQSTAMSAIPL